jgi:hypothetical protein
MHLTCLKPILEKVLSWNNKYMNETPDQEVRRSPV